LIAQKRLCVGEICTVHGVRGLVKVRAYGDNIGTLQNYGPLYDSEYGDKTHTLTLKHQAGGSWIAEIEGITDRNIAEKLRGTQLWLDRDKLPELEDAVYYADLMGMHVADKDCKPLGTVIGIEDFGAGELLDIKPDGKPSFYLPFADIYIMNIDDETRIITVDLPEGLIEE
jgi:16S rRNA processing protein RimM